MQTLDDQITAAVSMGFIKIEVPYEIESNLNQKFILRPYQEEAFARFIYYSTKFPQKPSPMQVLFHMATGSGKTLIMAGCMLHLYQLGYRNFIFFVNSSNIIEKTKTNFLDKYSSKYLFNSNITFKDQKVNINEVDNFDSSNYNDINIVFSTIQAMHSRLNNPKENSITYQDFEDKKIVLLSDEAHHINTETKNIRLNKDESEAIISWEGTVAKIFNSNPENYLLEFTATSDLSHPEIKSKYIDKVLFDYPLKSFKNDGYSKEVKILQAELSPIDRAIQAVIISQYRRKVFESYGKLVKPVILLKSKTIIESQLFLIRFIEAIKKLDVKTISKFKNAASSTIMSRAFNFFSLRKITIENLIFELQEDFSENKCISVDSKHDSDEKQIVLNSLEDENNEFRAIFAVDKLNEGWDVLNLFDIVRLYDTRDFDGKSGKIGKTTMSEAQLIGRGARYCPFKITNEQPMYQRKYDYDIDNHLRVCEELFFHASYNPRYISELNKALEEIGLKSSKTVERKIRLKQSFKDTTLYKRGIIYLNKRIPNDRNDIKGISRGFIEYSHTFKLSTGFIIESSAFSYSLQMEMIQDRRTFNICSFGHAIVKKALNCLSFFKFSNLKKYFPILSSMGEFINSDLFLGSISITIVGSKFQIDNLTAEEKLNATVYVLDKLCKDILHNSIEFKGSNDFLPHNISSIFTEKTLNIKVDEESDSEYGISQSQTENQSLYLDLSKVHWYAFEDNYGTSEEKYLVKYIQQAYESLMDKFDNVYLLRNEKHFKIYSFRDGRAIEPDFVLFLEKREHKVSTTYQVFIEPKGQHLFEHDKWKENFLKEIKDTFLLQTVFENKDFKLIGLPFFNQKIYKREFQEHFNKI